MAYNQDLVERLRTISKASFPQLEEKSMFGGVGFFVQGNYAYGGRQELIVRVGPEGYEAALAQPHVREMDITGRPMKGWVIVGLPAVGSDEQMEVWMRQGVEFASQLPPK